MPSTTVVAAGSQARTSFERGRDIYNYRCYFCHGYAGDAKTLAATYLTPPPRDFSRTPAARLPRARMIQSVTHGRPGTAMQGFGNILSAEEIAAVVDFVRTAFMSGKRANTRYHTAANGWPDHDRYRAAFPFATGEVALDMPLERLTPEQQAGRRLFMGSCITCHDRARVEDEGVIWDPRAVSYPRGGYDHRQGRRPPDSTSGATPYARHDKAPQLDNLSAQERRGEAIFQKNCAFCHAADGTGQNWIGSFLDPHPRNLTDPKAMAGMTRARLKQVIQDGLPGTTMSAWRNVLTPEEINAVVAYVFRAFIPASAQKQR